MPCFLCGILKVQAAGGIDRGPEGNGGLSLRYAFFNCRGTRRQGDIRHDGHKARLPKEGPRSFQKKLVAISARKLDRFTGSGSPAVKQRMILQKKRQGRGARTFLIRLSQHPS